MQLLLHNPKCQPVVRRGSSGDSVRLLQGILGVRGYSPSGGWTWGGEDPLGTFGDQTAEVVKLYQEDQGLAADGVVGPQTWKALGEEGCQVQSGGMAPLPFDQPFYQKWWFWPVVLGTLAAGGGGAYWYFRVRKPR